MSEAVVEKVDRDPARAALRDLVLLASETAAKEAQIEQSHAQALDAAEKELAKAKSNLDLRVKSVREELDQKHQARLEQINTRYESELKELKETDAARRRHIHHEHDTVHQDVTNKVQQAVWLVESVLEGVQNGLKDDSKNAREEHARQLEALDQLERSANALVARYRQQPPGDVAIPVQTIEGKPEVAFARMQAEAERRLEQLRSLGLPRLFLGIKPFVLGILACAAGAVVGNFLKTRQFNPAEIDVGGVMLGRWRADPLWRTGGTSVLCGKIADSKDADAAATGGGGCARRFKSDPRRGRGIATSRRTRAINKRNMEVQAIKAQYAPQLQRAAKNRDSALATIQTDYNRKLERIESQRDKALADLDAWQKQNVEHVEQRYNEELAAASQRHDAALAQANAAHRARSRGAARALEQRAGGHPDAASAEPRGRTEADEVGRRGVEDMDAAQNVQPQDSLWRAARGHQAGGRAASADARVAADVCGASVAVAPAAGVVCDSFRPRGPAAGDRDAPDGDGAAADEPAGGPGALYADRSGRAGAELRGVHAPGGSRRGAGRRADLDRGGAHRSAAGRSHRAHGDGDSEIPAQRVRDDRRLQRAGGRTGRAVSIPGHRGSADEFLCGVDAAAGGDRFNRCALRGLHPDQPRSAPAAAGRIAFRRDRVGQRQRDPAIRRAICVERRGFSAVSAVAGRAAERGISDAADGGGRPAAREAKRVEVPFTSIAPPAEKFWTARTAADVRCRSAGRGRRVCSSFASAAG